MKIIALRSLNINSFKGEIEIDFEQLLMGESLFAIVGPTGSGKSTLLDIITCALYGRTVRLKNPNELMSRHTGECFCEVEFELNHRRYRSSWRLKRARKKPLGRFQGAQMELVDLEQNQILETSLRGVPKKIEEICGLDFDRFTQSMMLAQGHFDAFLKAKESERSKLLEKITGTAIYAKISTEIFDRYSQLREEIKLEKRILEQIKLPTQEDLQLKKSTLESLLTEKEELQKQEKFFLAQRSVYLELEQLNRLIYEKEQEHTTLVKELQRLEMEIVDHEVQLQSLDQQRVEKERWLNRELERIQHVRHLKIQIEERQKRLSILQSKIRDDKKEINAIEDQLSHLVLRHAKRVEEIKADLGAFWVDGDDYHYSQTQLMMLSEDFLNQKSILEQHLKKELYYLSTLRNYQQFQQQLSDLQDALKKREQIKASCVVEIGLKRELIKSTQAHLKTLHDQYERELLIQKYEADRAKLVEGERCFLCGSKEHPYQQIESVDLNSRETLHHIEKKRTQLHQLEQELRIKEDQLLTLAYERDRIQSELTELNGRIDAMVSILAEEEVAIGELKEREIQDRVDLYQAEIDLLRLKHQKITALLTKSERLAEDEIKKQALESKLGLYQTQLKHAEQESRCLEEEIIKLQSDSIKTLPLDQLLKYEQQVKSVFKKVELQRQQQHQHLITATTQKQLLMQQLNKLLEQIDGFSQDRSALQKKLTSALSLDEFTQELKAFKERLEYLYLDIGAREAELRRYSKEQKAYQQQQIEIDKRVQTFKVWTKLNEMIGSADGNKFAKFAQGITLDRLIYLANRHLKELSRRYVLQRSKVDKHLLEIEVVDAFQGGAIRPVNTLSGGESFIVSLALALGLSALASETVSIDSLFLDEGFGSLDEESLDMALHALSLLQDRGKMVGVISHVSVLKERIPLQIKIDPKGDGTSRVTLQEGISYPPL